MQKKKKLMVHVSCHFLKACMNIIKKKKIKGNESERHCKDSQIKSKETYKIANIPSSFWRQYYRSTNSFIRFLFFLYFRALNGHCIYLIFYSNLV